MFTQTWLTKKEREQETKKKETNFVGRKTWRVFSGAEEMTNASGRQGENERQWKKAYRNAYDISSIKRV